MSGPKRPSSYDAFSSVDKLVSKPVLGSDGALSWQQFQSSTKKSQSRGVAPHMPLKRADKLSGMKSIQEERRNEENLRKSEGERSMGSGYTTFKRKDDKAAAMERKRRKLVMERKRPEDKQYFFKADTFNGWKEDYVFTTRDSGLGYYWDGMDSLRKLTSAAAEVENNPAVEKESLPSEQEGTRKRKVKKEKKKSKSKKRSREEAVEKGKEKDVLPEGWETSIDPTTCKTYYYNRVLGKTSWEKPTAHEKPIADEQSKSKEALPDGWETSLDPTSGKTYFYNRTLNLTTWERPTS